MARNFEEPIFINVKKNTPSGENIKSLEDDVRKLLEYQQFAVLATQGEGITVASLITFASSFDLKNIVFVTPRDTGKFNQIARNENISLLVDDRSLQQDSINKISALTITGKARILSNEKEILEWSELLLKKHLNLKLFLEASTSAIILIEVVQYHYVKRFQEIWEWAPSY
jgi:nitroimidazol reductase NimA-like FMN-containing flavoprotein (pyridoxamine 5'-phosphate oxidase superfamily)